MSRAFFVSVVLFLSSLGTSVFAEVGMETVAVAMRDGIHLATDVYRDTASEAPAPVVLMRTPYDKTKAKGFAEQLVKAGYVAVIQDCRGTHASEGILIPYNSEGQDGYDCIEWITRQPWCNGRVGMTGASYVGATQWQAAVENPPGLVTIAPKATWSSFYRNLYLGGAVRLSLIAKWAGGNSARPEGVEPPTDWDEVLKHLPLSEVDDEIGWSIPWLEGMLVHPEPNGYWTRLNLTPEITHLELPM
ncbi:MAG: CocE/NonD family hydrolase, partial [Verrucomicrobiae bacterium]|nr:CocE/NonD family hydrolase [Verrucomicrobiae bacterium]